MNPKHTWLWVLVAASLFAGIFCYQRFAPKPETGLIKLLPGFKAESVASIEILPANQRAIHVDRSAATWQLTEPIHFPARNSAIAELLKKLEDIVPTTRVNSGELGNMRDANEKFGFNPPPFTIVVQPGDQHIQIGNKNGPGDSVFVKVVGRDGIAVVDAGLLKLVPHSVDDWRENALVDLTRLEFDQLFVTNGAKVLELQRNLTNGFWKMIVPMEARADLMKIAEPLQKLQNVRASQFLDRSKSDLDGFGLQPPELSLTFRNGTNAPLLLAFGKSPTNDATQIYARRNDEGTVMLVPKDALEPWHAAHETFRDRHLISPTGPLSAIEFHAAEEFTLLRTNGTWIVMPQNYAADPALVSSLLTNLGALQVSQFYQDVVVAQDLPALGLTVPSYKIIFQALVTNSPSVVTNMAIQEIDFGTNQNDLVFAQRADEGYVYTVKLADVRWLPFNAVQLRERSVWNFSTNDVVRLTIQENGKTRSMLRKENAAWSIAPGSQGIMDDVTSAATEEIIYRFGHLEAETWIERGEQNRERYGFRADGLKVTLELKNGKRFEIELGGQTNLGVTYAEVTQSGEPWIFEISPMLYQLVQSFLAIPPDSH